MRLCKQCAIGGGGHEHAGSWEVDDVAVLLLPLGLIWAEVQDSVYEPGAAQTPGLTKRGGQDEPLRISDARAKITACACTLCRSVRM